MRVDPSWRVTWWGRGRASRVLGIWVKTSRHEDLNILHLSLISERTRQAWIRLVLLGSGLDSFAFSLRTRSATTVLQTPPNVHVGSQQI